MPVMPPWYPSCCGSMIRGLPGPNLTTEEHPGRRRPNQQLRPAMRQDYNDNRCCGRTPMQMLPERLTSGQSGDDTVNRADRRHSGVTVGSNTACYDGVFRLRCRLCSHVQRSKPFLVVTQNVIQQDRQPLCRVGAQNDPIRELYLDVLLPGVPGLVHPK